MDDNDDYCIQQSLLCNIACLLTADSPYCVLGLINARSPKSSPHDSPRNSPIVRRKSSRQSVHSIDQEDLFQTVMSPAVDGCARWDDKFEMSVLRWAVLILFADLFTTFFTVCHILSCLLDCGFLYYENIPMRIFFFRFISSIQLLCEFYQIATIH